MKTIMIIDTITIIHYNMKNINSVIQWSSLSDKEIMGVFGGKNEAYGKGLEIGEKVGEFIGKVVGGVLTLCGIKKF